MIYRVHTSGTECEPLHKTYNLQTLPDGVRKRVNKLDALSQRYNAYFMKGLLTADELGEGSEYFKQVILFADMADACDAKLEHIFSRYNIEMHDKGFADVLMGIE